MENLRKTQYSIDNILLMLREKDIFNVQDVRIGILEANGNLTVMKKAEKATVTLEDMKLTRTGDDLAMPLIIEGKLYKKILFQLNLDEKWLMDRLAEESVYNLEDIFFASITEGKSLHITLRKQSAINIPPIYH
ncbi:hypothetical protein SAMD00020551_2085 [Mesobacillus selenatarsenatis SF-1]|uniref:YetF C-terminal domain-containing protein n=1 Tax=Mesobacillus selenatarsenatis (strain DSM 18680 / JCM 14380 / FERM P-15431 / SF-1) TaxID=1321606 RepID=A0A0A8X208_MESS1|nr:DUF421 domain-containing protein [Mesobacillus selenatarsenatis]GAM13938.1 hypothetical protein SAMD00020551_2085 [Mesobacillus selenatarsenatis SF-1]